ncbi:MAG: hypothetical protein ACXWFC_10885 [Nitrososphaeraceae archaeon]
MTAKLFAEMMNLINQVRQFLILDYKYLLLMKLTYLKIVIIIGYTKKQHYSKKLDKLTFLNSLNNNFYYSTLSD